MERKTPESLLHPLKATEHHIETTEDLLAYTAYLHCLVWISYPDLINMLRKHNGYNPLPVAAPPGTIKCKEE